MRTGLTTGVPVSEDAYTATMILSTEFSLRRLLGPPLEWFGSGCDAGRTALRSTSAKPEIASSEPERPRNPRRECAGGLGAAMLEISSPSATNRAGVSGARHRMT